MSAGSDRMSAAQETAPELHPLFGRVLEHMQRDPMARALSMEALSSLAAHATLGAIAWFGPLLREAVEAPAMEYPRPAGDEGEINDETVQ